MSTHSVKIIQIENIFPHDNADTLDVIPIGGWQVIAKQNQYVAGDKAIYIEPDYVVPTDRPEFDFLAKEGKTTHRLKAIKLRGKLSFGMLIPVPEHLTHKEIGDNVMDDLGIVRYEPPETFSGKSNALPKSQWPKIYCPKFDVESFRNYPDKILPGEYVMITEKIHGANARFVFNEGQMYVGSRNQWLQDDGQNAWSKACSDNIRDWCREHDGTVLFGEIYGNVQSLKYGLNNVKFAAFAALDHGEFINLELLFANLELFYIETVPVLKHSVKFHEGLLDLAEGDSRISTAPKGHIMEGIVITPLLERTDPDIGRICLKHISNRYWTGKYE